MKRIISMGMALWVAFALPIASAETVLAGQVTAQTTQVIAAPYGGLVENVRVRVGDMIHIGDPIATLETTKVYAQTEGTVSGVFANEGDNAKGIEQRYGALVYIEPINRFTLACSMEKAYNSSENRYLHIGEKVYLRCTKDRSHQGWGVLTAIDAEDENKFTVEVTGGAFYMGETVNIYRDSAYNGKSCIGRGTVGRTQTVAITGEGSVLRMHVRPGDTVERGELLFETVKGTLDGLYAPDKQVVSPLNGVVAAVDATNGTAVDKDAKLVTVYPSDSLQIQMLLTEEDLSYIYVGKEALIEFNWDNQSRKRFDGAVSAISFVNREDDEANATGLQSAQYLAYLDFTPDETVRLGMTVTVYLQ